MKEREFERVLKALANKRRLAIISLLKKKYEASVGEIAENIKLSIKATSKHLNLMLSADILDKEQRSLQMYYSISTSCPKLARLIINLL